MKKLKNFLINEHDHTLLNSTKYEKMIIQDGLTFDIKYLHCISRNVYLYSCFLSLKVYTDAYFKNNMLVHGRFIFLIMYFIML